MSLYDISAIGFVGSHAAVVWTCKDAKVLKPPDNTPHRSPITQRPQLLTLRSRETIRWPAKWVSVSAQDGVLLLHAKPGMLVRYHIHHLVTCDPKVGLCKGRKRFRGPMARNNSGLLFIIEMIQALFYYKKKKKW